MQATCVECSDVLDSKEMVKYGEQYVCSNCKTSFFQKIKEGVTSSNSALAYKGFWIRFCAVFLDGIIVQIVVTMLTMMIGLLMLTGAASPEASMVASVIGALIGFLIGLAYEVFMVGKYGSTFGKMACNIKIVQSNGMPVGYGLAFGRYFAKMLSGIILGIGYIMAGFDEEKRALHDRICDTRAVARK